MEAPVTATFLPRVNPKIKRLVCSKSGRPVSDGGFARPIGLCRCCPPPGKPVIVEYDLTSVSLDRPDHRRGMWSFADLLPTLPLPPSYAADVGVTPTIEIETWSRELGLTVLAKHEGSNPSGSFKDRGLAAGIAFGRACGAERFCLPTQGNAGVAAALFSSRLGLPGCLVYMPEGYQDGLYHREARYFGADVRFFGPNIAAAGKKMRDDLAEELASGAYVDLSTFFEPGRLEGKKTMGIEIFFDLGAKGLPGWILYPTGGGTGLVGIWKAFRELSELGLINPAVDPLPRMVAVQSAACAPVVESFQAERDDVAPVESRGTVADGLDVPGAIMGHGILKTIRESRGTAVAVTENEILAAFAACGAAGVAASFESAAVFAALCRLRGNHTIGEGERVLLLLTAGHLIALGQKRLPRAE